MADIRIVPGSSIMSFTSSLNFTEKITQDASGSLNLYGSGSTGRAELFSIDGNNGRLFTVSDDLSDSLFSVNTIAGLPVIEAFANNTVVMGQYGTNALVVSGSKVGIGTTSPSSRLDVRAQGALATDIAFRVRNSTDTQNFLVVNGAGDVYNNGAGGINTNTFFGENVGRNTTGGYNTAIGLSALQSNTTGFSNTAIGTNALRSNTTGGYNTAIGTNALFNNTTGFSNTAIGLEALYNNTTGGYNTAIGLEAGRSISDGSSLTIINNSIFIGFNTRALADNQTNQIVIGHQAIGLGSNSVVLGNDSITKTILKGKVGIGTTSPTQELDVNGNIKATSFIKTGGTSTQFLMADGSVNNTSYITKNTGNITSTGWSIQDTTTQDGRFEFIGGSYPALAWGISSAYMSDEGVFYIENAGIGQTDPNTSSYFSGFLQTYGGLEVSRGFTFKGNNEKTVAETVGKLATNTNTNNFELIFNRSAAGTNAYYGIQSVEQGVGYRNIVLQKDGGNVGIGTTSPSEKLDVNGNIKAIDIIDQQGISIYLKLKTVNGNVTIDNSYHNKIVRITASCTITIPAGLRTDFNCTFEVIGAYTAQFVDGSGATTSAPFGRYLKTDLTAMFYCTGTASNYRLNGSLATS